MYLIFLAEVRCRGPLLSSSSIGSTWENGAWPALSCTTPHNHTNESDTVLASDRQNQALLTRVSRHAHLLRRLLLLLRLRACLLCPLLLP